MTILQPAAGIRPMDPLDVLARWRQRSMAADWRVEADWLCAGTRSVATAFARGSFDPTRPLPYSDRFTGQPTAGQPTAGQPTAGQQGGSQLGGKVFNLGALGAGIKTADPGSLEPVRQLGAARAYDGVGIAEALTDVGALFSAHDLPTPMKVTAAFAEAWVEASSLLSVAISCTDPASGLSTWPHFRNRLYELYGAHEDVSRRFLLAVLRHPSHHGAGRRWELEARIGHICADNFTRSGTVLSRAPDAVIVLSERTQDAFGRINSCAAELNTLLTGQFPDAKVRIDVEPLPDDVHDVARLLDSLRR